MRHARLAFAFLAITAALFAAEPFAGTWKLNTAKSKYKAGEPPKEQTVTIAESDSNLDVTIKGTAADGTAISSHYTVPAAGGVGTVIEGPYDGVSGKRPGPDRREVTYSKEGKVVLTVHSRISKDGKTMTVNVKGTDSQGKQVDAVAVYDRE